MPTKRTVIALDFELSNDFKLFFFFNNHFNIHDFTEEVSGLKNVPSDVTVHIDSGTVSNLFRKTKERKSPGPDAIGGRILKNCALQLADIVCSLFNMSLQTHRVPRLWKDSVIVSVPKSKAVTLACCPYLISNEVISKDCQGGPFIQS